MSTLRKPYSSDVTDDEWWFLAPYLLLVRADAGQRVHDPRELLNAVRYVVRTGCQWRMLPNDLPPWQAAYQQARRWLAAGSFEDAAHDLRELVRVASGREPAPTACVIDGRTLRSTPESGARAGYDGHKRTRGSRVSAAVDTLGLLLALRVAPASGQERAEVAELCGAVQAATGQSVALAYVDQGYTGAQVAADAAAHGVTLEVVAHPATRRGFVLLPRRWVVERTFAWMARSRRMARDYERTQAVLAGWHWVAFVTLMLHRLAPILDEVHNRL